MRTAAGIAVAAVLAVPAAAGPSAAEPEKPDYAISVKDSYLTGDVGDTVTVRPEVFVNQPDGSRVDVPKGSSVGGGQVIEYVLPPHTSPVGLDKKKGCKTVKDTETPGEQRVRCDTVTALTIRLDRAHLADAGRVRLDPGSTSTEDRPDNDSAYFLVAAPAPQEEGETKGSREGRESAGFALLGGAGGSVVLAVFLLVRGRARRTGWGAGVVGAVCAGLGVWSVVQGPLIGDKAFVTYPSGPAELEVGSVEGTIWDDGLLRVMDRPAYIPEIATAPDPGNETVTEVSAVYSAEGVYRPRELWATLDGASGRIEDPKRARNHMLETAAGAPGAKVLQKPRLILLPGGPDDDLPVLFKCQELLLPEPPAEDRTVSMCAWADHNSRGLVTVSSDSLPSAAGTAMALRDTVQLGVYP